MFQRLLRPSATQSFFLFGARGTGKTTLLHALFEGHRSLFIDLLDLEQETRFLKDPELLGRIVDELAPDCTRIILDEIQKAPRLLDVVHRKLEERKRQGKPLQFVMTGSSARKLKRGASNLLAGRAFVHHLFPLSRLELKSAFRLQTALEYGALPEVWNLNDGTLKTRYLEAYSRTYLKEEVWNEQVIRKLEPFSNFLEVAAQMNGEILNYAKIARDIGADTKTVQSYFQILEDTLLGYSVPAYHRSIRKRQLTNPKFYFFDCGVKRALDRTLSVPLLPQTPAFGKGFEHFIFLEIARLSEYLDKNFRFFYLKTHDGAEVDFIIERPGRPIALLEIKSTRRVDPKEAKHLRTFVRELGNAQAYLFSLDPTPQRIGPIQALPWEKGLEILFTR